LGGLWALVWAWHTVKTNLRCVRSLGICIPSLNSLAHIVSEISAFIRTEGQTNIARSTQLVILIKNIYTLWGMHVTCSASNGCKNGFVAITNPIKHPHKIALSRSLRIQWTIDLKKNKNFFH